MEIADAYQYKAAANGAQNALINLYLCEYRPELALAVGDRWSNQDLPVEFQRHLLLTLGKNLMEALDTNDTATVDSLANAAFVCLVKLADSEDMAAKNFLAAWEKCDRKTNVYLIGIDELFKFYLAAMLVECVQYQ